MLYIYIDEVNDLNIKFICPLTPYENKITINFCQYMVITYNISQYLKEIVIIQCNTYFDIIRILVNLFINYIFPYLCTYFCICITYKFVL